MSRNFTVGDIEQIKLLISEERLTTFRSLTSTDDDAIELHQATMMLGASLMSVTGVIEIALRNSIYTQLTMSFGTSNWLRCPPAPFRWAGSEKGVIKTATERAQRAAYSKLHHEDKRALNDSAFPEGVPAEFNHKQIANRRQKTIEVSDGQVISQLTIHFWKRLFAENYERTLWKRSLKRVFPNKTYKRTVISENLEILYQTRNRLAHHEPVYGARLSEIIETIEFLAVNLGSRIPDNESAMAKFILPHKEQLESQVAIFEATFSRLSI